MDTQDMRCAANLDFLCGWRSSTLPLPSSPVVLLEWPSPVVLPLPFGATRSSHISARPRF
eukprot:4667430-Prymnesium_polylepis.2